MMTFRPYANHQQSAKVLDYRRLGKQRVEAYQIMSAMMAQATGEQGGWTNHPIVLMWAGRRNPYLDHHCGQMHLDDLIKYYYSMATEWERRGYNHSMDYKVLPFQLMTSKFGDKLAYLADHPLPWGPKNELQHKHILLRKDPEHYGRFWRVRSQQV